MIAEMRKLNLVAMSYDRDGVLNALQRTGATEITDLSPTENTVEIAVDCEEKKGYLARLESAIAAVEAKKAAYGKENKIKTERESNLAVSYSQFMAAGEYKPLADEFLEVYGQIEDRRRELISAQGRIMRGLKTAEPYSGLDMPVNLFADTAHAKIMLGTLPQNRAAELSAMSAEGEFAVEISGGDGESALAVFACHKGDSESENVLRDFGFTVCPYKNDPRTGARIYEDLQAELSKTEEEIRGCDKSVLELADGVKKLKVYCDFLRFEIEKQEAAGKMRSTECTFLLEAYVPKDCEQLVQKALEEATSAVYLEFSDPAEDEVPPTLYRNNAVVQNFEAITNMYSPASSKEFDPNTVMGFFYSLFLGFIMADWGYGLVMLIGGGLIWWKGRGKDGFLYKLAGVFAVGGIFTIVWGLLFNSLFGIQVLPFTVMPDAQADKWQFMGITMPALLIVSMIIGVAQLMVGYVCRAVQSWRKGDFWDGVWDGVIWALFSLGIGLAIVGLVDDFDIRILAYTGGIMAGVCLVLAMLTAGRKEKFFGKFTKGFGAAYGVINYASDVLSYARLFGLMLSGAIIAQIISSYAIGFITGGNFGFALLGIFLMVFGHVCNLALSLLGAYIHDARLQYVEFYGKFFNGEGELFTPLGSVHKYVSVSEEKG